MKTYVYSKDLFALIAQISKLYDEKISLLMGDSYFTQKTSKLVLQSLYYGEELTQTELVELTHMRGSTVSSCLSKLEEGGYITRKSHEYDLRSNKVALSKKGVEATQKMQKIANEEIKNLMYGITPKEQKIAEYVLDTIFNNLKK